jgi:hypothetical protein
MHLHVTFHVTLMMFLVVRVLSVHTMNDISDQCSSSDDPLQPRDAWGGHVQYFYTNNDPWDSVGLVRFILTSDLKMPGDIHDVSV